VEWTASWYRVGHSDGVLRARTRDVMTVTFVRVADEAARCAGGTDGPCRNDLVRGQRRPAFLVDEPRWLPISFGYGTRIGAVRALAVGGLSPRLWSRPIRTQ
jgi:hypothetical protein